MVGPLGQVSESINDTVSYSSAYRGLSTGNGIAVVPYGRLWYDELNIEGTAAPALPNYYDETLFNVTDLYNISSNQLAGALWYYELLTGLPGNVALVKDGGAAAQSTTSFLPGPVVRRAYVPAHVVLLHTAEHPDHLPLPAVGGAGVGHAQREHDAHAVLAGQPWLPDCQRHGHAHHPVRRARPSPTASWASLLSCPPSTGTTTSVNLFAPFLTGIHAVTFVLDGVANFANGPDPRAWPASSTPPTSPSPTGPTSTEAGAGFQEVDQPLNDGQIINSITSQPSTCACTLPRPTTQCPYTVPTISWPSSALTSYKLHVSRWPCASPSRAGPGGYGTLTSGFYHGHHHPGADHDDSFGADRVGHALRTSSPPPTGSARVRTRRQGTNITSAGDSWPVSTPACTPSPRDYIPGDLSLFASNNIYYPQYPQMDGYGINLMGTQDVSIGQDGDTHSKVSRLLFNYEWEEQDVDGVTYPGYVYWWYEYSGSAVFAPYTNQDMSAGGAFAQQCLNSYGSQLVFSFCYAYNSSSWVSYANGLATVVGPQSRLNRPPTSCRA